MQREHFLFIPEVSLILFRDSCVFLLQRQNTGYEDGKYCFIAGHKEQGETVKQAMVREAKEEADLDITERELVLSHFTHRHAQGHERAAFFFTIPNFTGEPRNAEPEKCSHCDWFPLKNLPEMMPYMRTTLDRYLEGHLYSDFGWERSKLVQHVI
ncbi:NUDIX hydrolase [Candidatus Peregrinibacteria bacterium CG10_big_fil_rev_8_21_14_0_10_49_16]|nr:MAG: NUDIX hydrolase [Candidatus Peregrinibacteria bacterium CG22_combo_CG10-13_8_21_14_all_49_11]PIR52016.1 MAG: NUDIX hydrolase [Candidatus Peregrinibacteria bacterium CG10_big_fil_rev_8_21_14_0_10_49_16]